MLQIGGEMTLKSRINQLEKNHQPKEPKRTITVDWGDCDETPEEKAKRIAERPTHTPEGEPIRYIEISWDDEPDMPGPDVDDETRIHWAEDVLGGDSDDACSRVDKEARLF
jgi:hypothetical protein